MALGWGSPLPGQGRGGDKGPKWTTHGPSRGLSAPSWSGWAGWRPSWLLRAAHHPPKLKLNCRGAGQARRVRPAGVCSRAVNLHRGLLPGAPPPSWPTSLSEHLLIRPCGSGSGRLVGAPVDGALGQLTTRSPVLGLQHHRPRLCHLRSPTCLPCPLTPRVWGHVPSPPTTTQKGGALPGQ